MTEATVPEELSEQAKCLSADLGTIAVHALRGACMQADADTICEVLARYLRVLSGECLSDLRHILRSYLSIMRGQFCPVVEAFAAVVNEELIRRGARGQEGE